jgi:ABC-type multidrug transport system permease subunit
MNRAALDQASARPATPQTIFYVPGAIALRLQHLAITLSARSMLRERQFGRFELFRVTPITPGEILAGQ